MNARLAIALAAAALACGNEDNGQTGSGGSDSGIVSLSGSGTDTEGDPVEDDDQTEKLDVGMSGETEGVGDCPGGGGGMMGADAFSVIWIANSPAGTVSKIDTATREELGRFWSGPTEGDDDPSRTSVNLRGNVAVTNRSGSITKIAAVEADCVDANGDGMITTSRGPNDVLAWGEDECVLWHQELPHDDDNRHGPRPTAWDGSGDDPCTDLEAKVWVGWYDHPENTGRFRKLDGNTGMTLGEAEEPDWDPEAEADYGPYGGAVDREGDFWVSGRSPGPLIEVHRTEFTVRRWDVPDGTSPYGIAMDANGHPWMAGTDGSMLHFDPDTEQFDVIPVTNRLRGLMVDANGFAWAAANDPCGAVKVDTATLTVVEDAIELPGCDDPVGVSIDNEGFVWLPDRGAGLAFKLDPNSYASEVTITPLEAPYTYSDMTGFGLGLVTTPPQG